jgi:hypothetical protein
MPISPHSFSFAYRVFHSHQGTHDAQRRLVQSHLAVDVMSDKIDAFIAEIRTRPAFAAVAAADRVWSEHLTAIEFALNEIDRRANEDPAMVEVFDKVVALISDNDRTLKQRLLDLNEVLIPLRDQLWGVRH